MPSESLQKLRMNSDVPRHVAIIMDGNGRWASQRGLPRHLGHREGIKSVRDVVEGAVDAGVEILTLYAFSTENWQRPPKEVSALMALLKLYTRRERAELRRKGVEVHILGELDRLDDGIRKAVDGLVEATCGGNALRLNLMVSYGGREEILHATRQVACKVREGLLDSGDIDEAELEAELFTAGLPDPDLLIRTSGERRLSNFLLWQLAYAEWYTAPVFWPDFRREDLFEAIVDYQRRERRFGRVSTP